MPACDESTRVESSVMGWAALIENVALLSGRTCGSVEDVPLIRSGEPHCTQKPEEGVPGAPHCSQNIAIENDTQIPETIQVRDIYAKQARDSGTGDM